MERERGGIKRSIEFLLQYITNTPGLRQHSLLRKRFPLSDYAYSSMERGALSSREGFYRTSGLTHRTRASGFDFYLDSKSSAAELMQNLKPVGWGPSSNTWPKCASQLAHRISMRSIPWLSSTTASRASALRGW
jgi:hypothetical protein